MNMTNFHIACIFIGQLLIAGIASVIGTTWAIDNSEGAWYLGIEKSVNKWHTTWGLLWILNTGTWILINTSFVPISLMVTLEIVKFWQAMFMEYEEQMYDAE